MNGAEPVVIFLHIPKACGTTLAKLLGRWCEPGQVFHVGRATPTDARARLSARAAEPGPPLRLVTGHAAFGLHEALPGPARYITVLRDPVERVLSSFHYIVRTPQHRLHAAVKSGELGLGALAARFANQQTRFLCGSLSQEPDAASLERAKEHLRTHFAVAGLAERFEESALLIHRAFGRPLRPYASENVGTRGPSGSQAGAEERRAVGTANELDLELYEFVKARFCEQIAAQDGDFARAVGRLRRANRLLNFGARLARPFTGRRKERP